ncbi:MAG: hypothetical protein ABJF10_09675 [Chthoniobacter sp.]|uniref:hypothetical protein n=1 Tax=Chthoniobacter sp. TaxID=2510640 RepID=UPI0032A789FF
MPAPVKLPLQTKSPPKGGRPCLLTPNRQAVLLKAIQEGLPLKQAARLASISYDTLNRWRKKGEEEYAPLEFRKFCEALGHSEATAMHRLVSVVSDAGKSDWRASAWILERRFREEFGKPQHTENSGPGGNPFHSLTPPAQEVDHEVLRRMRDQQGMRKMAARLGELLLKHQKLRLCASLKGCARLRE